MGKGKRYEMKRVNGLTEATTDVVWVTRPDFSGNSKHAFADVALVWPWQDRGQHFGAFLELKKRSPGDGKRASDTMKGSSEDQNGIEELQDLVEGTPPWGLSYLGVKFPNRELILLKADWLLDMLTHEDMDILTAATGEPALTPSGNISVRKPTLDNWVSAQAGLSDDEKILETVQVPRDYWK